MNDVCVILPALNEADALPQALCGRPSDIDVIVVDNGSTDNTAEIARSIGVTVVTEPRQGFGAACKAGLDAAGDSTVVVYMDADATCDWSDLKSLTEPILENRADLVLGRRVKRLRQTGSMPFHVVIANTILGFVCSRLAKVRIHDVPPYRAINRQVLLDLDLQDRTYGWPLEMVLKSGRWGYRVVEMDVQYRVRVGTSKVTGTLSGTLKATSRMLRVLWSYR